MEFRSTLTSKSDAYVNMIVYFIFLCEDVHVCMCKFVLYDYVCVKMCTHVYEFLQGMLVSFSMIHHLDNFDRLFNRTWNSCFLPFWYQASPVILLSSPLPYFEVGDVCRNTPVVNLDA